jgi:ribonuclease BN (tRNA processing enzyme)
VRVTVVGTGTASPRLRRRQSCVVVEAGGEMLVIDLGYGAVRGMHRAGLDPSAVDRVFFTHFHGDHTVGVVPLLLSLRRGAKGTKKPRVRPLAISGPEPFDRFWRSVFTRIWGGRLPGAYRTEVSELPQECRAPLKLPGCDLTWAPAEHRPESIAYRLENGGKAFVVTGDTEYAGSVVELARGAHTLLIDCSFPDQRPVQGHLTPSGVARVASEAGVERVVLTHISPEAERLDLVSEVARGYAGEVIVAEDGLKLDL